MLLKNIIDLLAAIPSGALVTDDNRFDYTFLISTFNTYRAHYIRDYFASKNRTLNNKWYQKYYPEYSIDDQDDDCHVRFPFPSVVTLDEMSDGLRYFGSRSNNAFARIKNRSSYSTYSNHRSTNPKKIDEISFLLDTSSRMVEVYGDDMIEEVMADCVFDNPLDELITTFNKDIDQYPVPDDAIPAILQMIYYGQTRIAAATEPVPAGLPTAQPKTIQTPK